MFIGPRQQTRSGKLREPGLSKLYWADLPYARESQAVEGASLRGRLEPIEDFDSVALRFGCKDSLSVVRQKELGHSLFRHVFLGEVIQIPPIPSEVD